MLSCILSINTCRGLIGLIGAMMVVVGVINTDGDYDNHGKTSSSFGNFFFFVGWLLFASSIGFIGNSVTEFIINTKSIFGLISSLLVAIAASLSQKSMYDKNLLYMRIYLVFFILSWIFLAYAISMPMAASESNQLLKFIIGLIGAAGVVLGMVFQMKYRKRGFEFIKTGQVSQANSYSPGLPLFTAGWLFIAFASAII